MNGSEVNSPATLAGTEPVLRFVAGRPTPEEIAAVVTVLAAGRGAAEATAAEPSGWSRYWRRTRRSLRPGPDAWRLSMRL